ncbi:hypothetical protein Anas_02688 [Armadillidium nasatum]|uniref:Uncharacterized protein n=1 Tax=Armadillidium nasatum TaxID=96803 RepID=A0A5N5SX53_9CRUS|nr:hypothetical protein Anas_02688 [Armadillidium nasatum]
MKKGPKFFLVCTLFATVVFSILKFTEFTVSSVLYLNIFYVTIYYTLNIFKYFYDFASGLKKGECPFCRQYFLSNAIQDNR